MGGGVGLGLSLSLGFGVGTRPKCHSKFLHIYFSVFIHLWMPAMNEVPLTSTLCKVALTECIAQLLIKIMDRKHCRISQSFVGWPTGTKYDSNPESQHHSVVCNCTWWTDTGSNYIALCERRIVKLQDLLNQQCCCNYDWHPLAWG